MSTETVEQVIEDDPIEVRRAKRAALIEAGKNPYGHAFDYSHHVADLDAKYESLPDGESTEDRVEIAGRIMAKRVQGKIIFFELKDSTARIQLFCRINALGEEAFAEMKDLDMGDWIGVSGCMMRTKRGQLSVAVDSFELLSKSLRPLPEKFHGLADKEIRYRQRYVDLIANEDVYATFVKRSKIVSAFRRYMEADGYFEVETPILQTIQGGATAKPFITHFNALNQECYLRIATELHLKRLLVGGFERVFEIGRIFRNEGMDPTHNPEFTTMEAYRSFSDLQGMKKLAEGVIKAACHAVCDSEQVEYQGQIIDLSGEWPSIPMTKIVSDAVGEEVAIDTPVERLAELAKKNGIEVNPEWTAGKLIAELYDEVGEPSIVNPTFVVDYPVEVSPLAKRFDDEPRLTDRFELVIAGHEYANAFSELNDPVDQAERFQKQMEEKASGDDEAMEYDTDYVRALEYGMPPAGGIGIGIDRVVMLLTNQPSIRDVLLFPHMKPEKNSGLGAAAGNAACVPGTAAQRPLGREESLRTAHWADSLPHMKPEKNSGLGAAAGNAACVPGTAAQQAGEEVLPVLDLSKVKVEPLFEEFVDFETFSKSDFRAVKVKDCSAVPKSKKLLQFTLDDGTDAERVILSGIHAFYEPEQLIGKTLVAITNLPPRKMMGIESCGMLLSAIHEYDGEEALNLLMLDPAIPAGAKLY